jgi:hypothetical protein
MLHSIILYTKRTLSLSFEHVVAMIPSIDIKMRTLPRRLLEPMARAASCEKRLLLSTCQIGQSPCLRGSRPCAASTASSARYIRPALKYYCSINGIILEILGFLQEIYVLNLRNA